VLKLLEDVVKLQPGEIMVPCTNPSWRCLHKDQGAVTDIGGLTSMRHCFAEYGLPRDRHGVATFCDQDGDIIS